MKLRLHLHGDGTSRAVASRTKANFDELSAFFGEVYAESLKERVSDGVFPIHMHINGSNADARTNQPLVRMGCIPRPPDPDPVANQPGVARAVAVYPLVAAPRRVLAGVRLFGNTIPGLWSVSPLCRVSACGDSDGANNLVMFGGHKDSDGSLPGCTSELVPSNDSWVYSRIARKWLLSPASSPHPAMRSDSAMAHVLNGAVDTWVMFGGQTVPNADIDTWVGTQNVDNETEWANVLHAGAPPGWVAGHSMVPFQTDDSVLLFGGWGTAGMRNSLFSFNTGTSTWAAIVTAGAAPSARSSAGFAYWGQDAGCDLWVLFGGTGDAGLATGQVHILVYDPTGPTWTWAQPVVAAGPSARYGCSLVSTAPGGDLVLMGGIDGDGEYLDEVWSLAYDPMVGWTWTEQACSDDGGLFHGVALFVAGKTSAGIVMHGGRRKEYLVLDDDAEVLPGYSLAGLLSVANPETALLDTGATPFNWQNILPSSPPLRLVVSVSAEPDPDGVGWTALLDMEWPRRDGDGALVEIAPDVNGLFSAAAAIGHLFADGEAYLKVEVSTAGAEGWAFAFIEGALIAFRGLTAELEMQYEVEDEPSPPVVP